MRVTLVLIYLSIMACNLAMAEEIYQYTDQAGNLVIGNKKYTPNNQEIIFGTNEDARHKILQEELEHEKLALQQSQTLQPAGLYYNDIALHQKNIDILTKQLNQEGIYN